MNKYQQSDRIGSRIHLEIHYYAYCFTRNIKYYGSIYDKISNKELLKEHIKLNKLLKIPYPKSLNEIGIKNIYYLDDINNMDNTINYNTNLHPEKNINNFLTIDFIKLLQNNVVYDEKKNNKINIVVHIRRGDVNPKRYPDRYLYNIYYINLLKSIISNISTENYEITILSEKKSYESFNDFTKFRNIKFDLDKDHVYNFKKIINSDIFIMSKSSYSYSPALFNKGIVICHPFWCGMINNWINSKDMNFETLLKEMINKMINKIGFKLLKH